MSNQPKWAWWVVGIVIPVVGIIVSIQLATKSDSDDKSDSTNTATQPPAATGGRSPEASSNPSAPPPAAGPAKVLAGPVKITLTDSANRVDLDTATPTAQPGDKGADAWVGFNLPDLVIGAGRTADVIAILPPEGADPTRDECNEAITKRGASATGELAQGLRLCLQTDEGRTAYVKITTVPSRKSVSLEATVWE